MTARQISSVTAVIRGTAKIGFIVDKLIWNPKYPFWINSNTITWNKNIARVFWLIRLRTRLPRGKRCSIIFDGTRANNKNKANEKAIMAKLEES